jgi:hypothetical protein
MDIGSAAARDALGASAAGAGSGLGGAAAGLIGDGFGFDLVGLFGAAAVPAGLGTPEAGLRAMERPPSIRTRDLIRALSSLRRSSHKSDR